MSLSFSSRMKIYHGLLTMVATVSLLLGSLPLVQGDVSGTLGSSRRRNRRLISLLLGSLPLVQGSGVGYGSGRRVLSTQVEGWSNARDQCGSEQYKLSLLVDTHLHLVAWPEEEAAASNTFSCGPLYFHDGQDGKEAVDLQEDIEDHQHDHWMSGLSLGSFDFASLFDAYEAANKIPTESTTDGYDVVHNNCATIILSMMKSLDIEPDSRVLEYTTSKLYENKKTVQNLRASSNVAAILPNSDERNLLQVSDNELLTRLVQNYVESFQKQDDQSDDTSFSSSCMASLPSFMHDRRLDEHRGLQSSADDASLFDIYLFVQFPEFIISLVFESTDGSENRHAFWFYFPQDDLAAGSVAELADIRGSALELKFRRQKAYARLVAQDVSFANIKAAAAQSEGEITGEYTFVYNNGYIRIVQMLVSLGVIDLGDVNDPVLPVLRDYVVDECVKAEFAETVRNEPDELAKLFNGEVGDTGSFTDELVCRSLVEFTINLLGECGNGVVEPGEGCDLGAENGPTAACTNFCAVNDPWYCLNDSQELNQFYEVSERRYSCKYTPPATPSTFRCPGESCARYWCLVYGLGTFIEQDAFGDSICTYDACPWAEGFVLRDQVTCVGQAGDSCDADCLARRCRQGGGSVPVSWEDSFERCVSYPCPHSSLFQHDLFGLFNDFDRFRGLNDVCYSYPRIGCDTECAERACELSGGTWKGSPSEVCLSGGVEANAVPGICLYRSTRLTCSAHKSEEACIEDSDCEWERNGLVCMAQEDACEYISKIVTARVTTIDGNTTLTPETTTFDIEFEGVDIVIDDVSVVTIDCPICYSEQVPVSYETLPSSSSASGKIRVYGEVAVALATPGYEFDLKIEQKSCATPIVLPLKTTHTKEPPVQWFSDETDPAFPIFNGMGAYWTEKKEFCEAWAMRLCTYEEICPYGPERAVAGDPFGAAYNDPDSTDFWVAVESSTDCPENSWVQAGSWRITPLDKSLSSRCYTHYDATDGECPVWGVPPRFTSTLPFQKYTACCSLAPTVSPQPTSSPAPTPERYDIRIETLQDSVVDRSFAASQAYCESDGGRLCELQEICRGYNLLHDFSKFTDEWVAYSGEATAECPQATNFVQIGSSVWPECTTTLDLSPPCPSWTSDTNSGGYTFLNFIICCSEFTPPPILSEVVVHPVNDEYVELFNPNPVPVVLTDNFMICDVDHRCFNLIGTIASGSYFVVCRRASYYEDIKNLTCDQQIRFILRNYGGMMSLKRQDTTAIVDEVSWSIWPQTSNSLARVAGCNEIENDDCWEWDGVDGTFGSGPLTLNGST